MTVSRAGIRTASNTKGSICPTHTCWSFSLGDSELFSSLVFHVFFATEVVSVGFYEAAKLALCCSSIILSQLLYLILHLLFPLLRELYGLQMSFEPLVSV